MLNEAQRQLAADNHDLIYWYLHKRGLPIEDYYDVLAIGLCKAAKAYKPEKGAFSTLAIRIFEHEISIARRTTSVESESLEENVYEDLPLYSMVANTDDRFRYITCWLTIKETLRSLSPLDKQIIKYYVQDGLSVEAIGELVGRSKTSVSNRINKIRKRVLEQLD